MVCTRYRNRHSRRLMLFLSSTLQVTKSGAVRKLVSRLWRMKSRRVQAAPHPHLSPYSMTCPRMYSGRRLLNQRTAMGSADCTANTPSYPSRIRLTLLQSIP